MQKMFNSSFGGDGFSPLISKEDKEEIISSLSSNKEEKGLKKPERKKKFKKPIKEKKEKLKI